MTSSVGQRNTAQREAIAEAIRAAEGPLTVDQIHERAGEKLSKLGIATVYRNVKLLLEAEQIQEVVLPDGQMRYEAADLDHHHHFHCRRCGQVFDLEGCPLRLPEKRAVPRGFKVEGHEVTLFGLCSDCAKKKR